MKDKKLANDMPVSEIMTRRSETLTPADTIKDALNLMYECKLTTIPIVDVENRCVGILSKSDLTEMFIQEDSELANSIDADYFSLDRMHRTLNTSDTRKVKELMTFDVTTVEAAQTIPKACQLMLKHQIHHLPVVNDDNVVVGIVSTFDIIKVMANENSFAAS